MKIKNTLPILWLPLLGVWTFLFAIQSNAINTDLESFVPFICYLVVSFLLILQVQLVIGNKREGAIVKFGTVNVLFICLFCSSLSILLNLLNFLENEVSIFFIILPLIANTFVAEVFSLSNRALVKKKEEWENTNQNFALRQKTMSEESAQFRNKSIEYREAWKSYLKQASIDYLDNSDIVDEITRLKEIVEFSSYFRSQLSEETLSKLKNTLDSSEILMTLRDIR